MMNTIRSKVNRIIEPSPEHPLEGTYVNRYIRTCMYVPHLYCRIMMHTYYTGTLVCFAVVCEHIHHMHTHHRI